MTDGLEPFVQLEVSEVKLAPTADGEAFDEIRVDVWIFELVGENGIEVEITVGFGVGLEFLDLHFEGVDFFNGALEGEAEGIHGAFEALERTVRAIDGPVPAEFLWAEDEDSFVFQLEVFDDGERGEDFSEADAIGEDAAIGGEDLVDGGFGSVLLERIERLPNGGV